VQYKQKTHTSNGELFKLGIYRFVCVRSFGVRLPHASQLYRSLAPICILTGELSLFSIGPHRVWPRKDWDHPAVPPFAVASRASLSPNHSLGPYKRSEERGVHPGRPGAGDGVFRQDRTTFGRGERPGDAGPFSVTFPPSHFAGKHDYAPNAMTHTHAHGATQKSHTKRKQRGAVQTWVFVLPLPFVLVLSGWGCACALRTPTPSIYKLVALIRRVH
jgi:hypothetical protein